MANKRIDELTASSSFARTDLMEKERDPSGAKAHEKSSLGDFVDWIITQLGFNVFQNLASLKANTTHVDNNVYFMLGYLTKGDGQAKIYFYDASSTAIPDDASVVLPDDIVVGDPGRYLQFTF